VRWLRQCPEFAAIPVVFFSGTVRQSQAPDLIREFNVPIVMKSVDFHENVGSVQSMMGLMAEPPGNPPAASA
jgi:hypothetical protein